MCIARSKEIQTKIYRIIKYRTTDSENENTIAEKESATIFETTNI